MQQATLNHLVNYGRFTIEGSAFTVESLWFPEYEIFDEDAIKAQKYRPSVMGFPIKEAAVDAAYQYAMYELDFGDALPA